MSRSSTYLAGLMTFAVTACAFAGNWPQWRGPDGDSVSGETGLPLRWSEKTNVVWKCPIPDEGASTPAVWGDAIFLTTQHDLDLLLIKINKTKGEIEWTRKIGHESVPRTGPKDAPRSRQKFHELHNMASPSPVTDGEIVIAHFGNGDLAAYNFAGKLLWERNLQKDHGTYTIWWGHANSPVLFKDLVISVCMQDSLSDLQDEKVESYVVAHDKRTGKEKWKTRRMTEAKAEECDSYTTPVFHKTKNGQEMIVMGGNQIDGYDPATGKQLWYLPGLVGGRTITGPTVAHDLVFATQGMRKSLNAVKLSGEGRLAKDAIAWKETKGTPDSSCPVVWKDLLFFISDDGIAQCRDARTGELKWKERLKGDNYKASPLAAEGRIYFLNRNGLCTVVSASDKFETLAENQIDDETIASLAVSDGKLYLRSKKALYCLGRKE